MQETAFTIHILYLLTSGVIQQNVLKNSNKTNCDLLLWTLSLNDELLSLSCPQGPCFNALKTVDGDILYSSFPPLYCTVWWQVWSECQPLWSAGQKRPLLASNHKHTLMEARWKRMMRATHGYPVLPGSTVPYDVRSDLDLRLYPQQERTAFVVSSELSVWSVPISAIHSGQSEVYF